MCLFKMYKSLLHGPVLSMRPSQQQGTLSEYMLSDVQLGMAQTMLEGQWADQQQPWGWQGKNNRKLQSYLPGLDDQVSHWLGIACAWLCCTMYSPAVQQSKI